MSDYQPDSNFAEPHRPASPGDGCRDESPAPLPVQDIGVARPLDLAGLADALPKLGTVLWLERRAQRIASPRATIGARGVLLLDHPALAVLGHCSTVVAHAAVTPQGPREWLCFHDAVGQTQGKLYLLPDTDYLAWDEMAVANHLAPSPPSRRWQAHAAFLRSALARLGGGWQARLLTFDLKRLPWLRTLAARPPLRISLLGLELARAIARAEGADFVSPLHIS